MKTHKNKQNGYNFSVMTKNLQIRGFCPGGIKIKKSRLRRHALQQQWPIPSSKSLSLFFSSETPPNTYITSLVIIYKKTLIFTWILIKKIVSRNSILIHVSLQNTYAPHFCQKSIDNHLHQTGNFKNDKRQLIYIRYIICNNLQSDINPFPFPVWLSIFKLFSNL